MYHQFFKCVNYPIIIVVIPQGLLAKTVHWVGRFDCELANFMHKSTVCQSLGVSNQLPAENG